MKENEDEVKERTVLYLEDWWLAYVYLRGNSGFK